MEESKLIERARGGDAVSYGELVRRYQGIAFRAAYLITEDAIQEAFTKAYDAMGRFRVGAPFRPWLLSIVANEARKRNRTARRRDRLALTVSEDCSSWPCLASPVAYELAGIRAYLMKLCLFLLAVLLASVGCGSDSGTAVKDRSANREPRDSSSDTRESLASVPKAARDATTIFALLANNELLKVSATKGRIEDKLSLGARPAGSIIDYHRLARSEDAKTIFALSPGKDPYAPSSLVAVDAATLRITQRYVLPEGVVFRSLAVGPETGRIYLFGNRPAGDGSKKQDALVVVLDPASVRVLKSAKIRAARGLDWKVYAGTVSSDEKTLFVSYHGTNTEGIDRIEITPDGFERCQTRSPAGRGCINAHGNVEVYGDKFLSLPVPHG